MKRKRPMKIVVIVAAVMIGLPILAVIILLAVRQYGSSRLNDHKPAAADADTGVYTLKATDGIVLLEDHLLAVRYDGDYGFDAFLEAGGAERDSDILSFFSSYFGSTAAFRSDSSAFGCSTVSVKNTDGGYLFGRNFDFRPCDAMIVELHPKNGYASLSTVDLDFLYLGSGLRSSAMSDQVLTLAAAYVPLDGINEKGLCISVNMIQDGETIQQDTGKPDLTTTTAIRLVLDKAATVEEAISLLSSYDLHASFNFMVHFAIADAEGNSVVVEYIGNEMTVTKTPVVTNFYLTPGAKFGIGTAQSMTRYHMLTESIGDDPEMIREDVRDLLESVSKHHFNDGETTEWSVVFDQTALTADYYHREDYTKVFRSKLSGEQGV